MRCAYSLLYLAMPVMLASPPKEFDYIIVGAGSAGAVLAARLSADPAITVCLIEAGKCDKHPLIHIPFGLAGLSRVTNLNWGYTTAPQTALNDRELFWPRGKTLGGSSSINAMCYIRGQYSDYDDWVRAGAIGWGAKDVIPWFKKAENFAGEADEYHGHGGPLQVNSLRHVDPLSRRFVAAAREVGLPQCNDFNRAHREGLGLYHVTQSQGQRCSSAKAYLGGITGRVNLVIKTQVLVEKILIKAGAAAGVQLRSSGTSEQILARSETIVCAGAINSPQLLMLSGIGPKQELQRHGIALVAEAPGVGQNLQDHLDVILQCASAGRHGYAVTPAALPTFFHAALAYAFRRNGPFSSNIAEAGGFACSATASPGKPDLQFHFLPARLNDHGRRTTFGYGFGLHVCNLYPKSRGEIRLYSSHPADPPIIDPRYLSHPADLPVMLDGLRMARQILHSEALAPCLKKEVLPGMERTSDSALTEFIREYSETIYHPVGTCKIGRPDDSWAVVDPELKVIKVKRLRVVDASVMPSIIGGNTHAAVVMIAERAACFILQDRQRRGTAA